MKKSIKELAYWVLCLGLISAGHTLAFNDEIAQAKINSQSATYVNDNKGEF